MLVTRYEQTWQLSDLEEAIRISRRAIKATPDDHPYLAGQLKNLGAMLTSQYERIDCLEDLDEAIRVSRKAARITSALPLERISAASLAIHLMLKQEARSVIVRLEVAADKSDETLKSLRYLAQDKAVDCGYGNV
ncbi:hypothetical protein BDV41DRAFT_576169 [Aspergillus transmontanensis]|uniref:Uncharacterized protein n=1 Tax=Aspergillus transmontanensis TaxID=1034304 RepID=A0A5N6W0E9_9EURO|nr:hypothetical protein BDV41DRAFT_576169 [Aspergillus transmontanensis]